MRQIAFSFVAITLCSLHGLSADEPVTATGSETVTIAKIMQRAHKKPKEGGSMLLKKVAIGRATTQEKKALLKDYQALAKLKPAKGDLAGWQAKTKLLLDAANAALKGNQGADKQLQRAANCTACHNEHKGV